MINKSYHKARRAVPASSARRESPRLLPATKKGSPFGIKGSPLYE